MSRVERIDSGSGAILFKKDKESRDLEAAIKKIAELEERIIKLEKANKSSKK